MPGATVEFICPDTTGFAGCDLFDSFWPDVGLKIAPNIFRIRSSTGILGLGKC